MSFGFSVGDFVAAASLITEIVSALRSSSTSAYRELVVELHNLERALDDIEHLKCVPEQTAAVTAVKVAALTCRFPLDEFATKWKKFQCLQEQGTSGTRQRVNVWRLKLEWGFTMEEEVQRLRTYLAAHVGSLNMRLTTLGLTSQTALFKATSKRQSVLEDGLTATQTVLQDIRKNLDVQNHLTVDSNSRLSNLTDLVTTNLIPMLLQLAHQVWISNVKLMTFVTWQQKNLQSPNLNHGWFQIPVKFEDACGRMLPIPSEYNWGKVHAIILDQFRTGPGHKKVSFGEYDLYDTTNRIRRITSSDNETLMPGMSITMAMRIGMYEFGPSTGCPNPACKSNVIVISKAGGRRCSICQVWHSITSEAPPQPFRMLNSILGEQNGSAIDSPAACEVEDAFKRTRIERMSFKNMQIHRTELSTLQSIFENGHLLTKRENQTLAVNKHDWNRSSVMPTHRLFKNNQHTPMSMSKLVLCLIAEDAGLKVEDLSPTTRFEEIGLDSLLSLSIVSQLRDAGLKLPNSIFWDFPTVQELEAFLDGS